MNCCLRLCCRKIWWLSGCHQAGGFQNGRNFTSSLLKIYTTSYPANNIYSGPISRHFGTSQELNAAKKSLKSSKIKTEEENRLSFQQLVLHELKSSQSFKNLVNAKLEDPEYFQNLLSKLKQLGFQKKSYRRNLSGFVMSEKDLDHYLKKLSELKDVGFSPNFFVSIFQSSWTKKDLSDIEKTLADVDILRTKYGMPVELIQDLIQDNVDELLKKVAILNSFRFPDPLDYAEYGFLLRLPLYSLQDLYHDLQESGLREYRVTDIQKHLEEKNYGIKNIALLSKFTGVTVSEIQRLTKHFNHKFIPIGSQKLEAKIKLMKWYGLTNEDICQVCCFLNLQMKVLKSILVKYTKLKGDGVLPWKIKVYLSNPCVQKMMSVRTVNTLGKHIMAFKSKLGFKMNLCPQTLISLLVLNMKPFTTMLEKIEILKSVLPIEEIITPEGIHFLTKLTKEGLIQGVKRSESLPELSIAHFEKSFFFRKVQILKKEQRRIISEMLNLSYVDVRKVSQMFETEHKDIQANIMLLQNYGFSVADIRKLFIVVYADTERLKYQLDVLSSRPEIQDYNLQVTSFKALNYVQYFLENDCKLKGVDQFGINDIDDDDDFENESDLRS